MCMYAHTSVCMYVYVCVSRWMGGWVDASIETCMCVCMCMYVCMCLDGWVGGWMHQ